MMTGRFTPAHSHKQWTRLLFCLVLSLALAACSDDGATTTADSAGGSSDGAPADKATPKPDQAAPKPDQAAPKPDQAAPKPDQAAPKPDQAAPKPDQAAPKPDQGSLPGCKTNTDCLAKNQFCNLPLGCKPPGTCKTKPKICPSVYDPVCGCDGKDYPNSCVANVAGVSVKSKGKCAATPSCQSIRTAYQAAVQAARKCSPMLPVVQCDVVVLEDLPCSCTVAVSKLSKDYVTLLALQAQWKLYTCSKQVWNCPKKPCYTPKKVCDSSSSLCM